MGLHGPLRHSSTVSPDDEEVVAIKAATLIFHPRWLQLILREKMQGSSAAPHSGRK